MTSASQNHRITEGDGDKREKRKLENVNERMGSRILSKEQNGSASTCGNVRSGARSRAFWIGLKDIGRQMIGYLVCFLVDTQMARGATKSIDGGIGDSQRFF